MELSFSKINGTNSSLNYDLLKDSIIGELAPDCDKAEILILNNFPVPVLSQATLDLVIFIKIPKHPTKRPKIYNDEGFVYLSNLIIAVSIIKEYKNSTVQLEDNQLIIDNCYIDLSDTASKLKWGLTNYFHDACGLIERSKITVHPVFWVINETNTSTCENIVISKNLTFNSISNCIALNSYLRYPGYSDWNYDAFYGVSINNILEQASKDSNLGYLTKQKIERFQNRFDTASQNAFDSIGKQLVEVRGKAGSGKSSDLLKWMLQKSLTGNKAIFLTYNHLLVFEISKQILGFTYNINDQICRQKASTTANTIHSFMFNISKKLSVVLLMSESRVIELKSKLDERFEKIKLIFDDIRISNKINSKNYLKNYFQNLKFENQEIKREAIDFINHNEIQNCFNDKIETLFLINSYKKFKIKQLEDNIHSTIFLADYHNVLKNTLLAIKNLDSFFKEFQIENKFDLIENSMNLKTSILEVDGSGKINLEELKKRYKRSINAFSHGRTLYLDEAQDCHQYERDIFFALFNPQNVVIASGGKEQLIRYSNVCNWNVSQNLKIDSYIYNKRRKSFRMKPAIAALANHIASSFQIDLNIEPLDTEDHGTIIIDRNITGDLSKKVDLINELITKGNRQGCTSYESLLMLKNSKDSSNSGNALSSKKFIINEFDVIKIDEIKNRSDWELLSLADKKINESRFWNATGNVNKKKQSVPGSLSIRAIYYESSRGLEAWSTMCFDLYGFFDSKRIEDEADNFLLDEIMDAELRKDKYAATWVLMALTRAIDTMYLEVSNSNNALKNSIDSFIAKYPHYIEYV